MRRAVPIAACLLSALTGCGPGDGEPQAGETMAVAPALPKTTPAPPPPQGPGTSAPPSSAPTATLPSQDAAIADEKGEAGARAVLETWARALESGDFDTARAQFGTPPPRSDYVRWWRRYRTIKVALAPGTMDAGAGSLFYAANATLTGLDRAGKPYRIEGEVLLRRVNDVDGATPAQLRWHIGSAVLEDAPA